MPEDNNAQLSQDEINSVREIIEADKRAKWLWASVRNVAVWVVAVIGGVSLTYDSMIAVVKHMAGK